MDQIADVSVVTAGSTYMELMEDVVDVPPLEALAKTVMGVMQVLKLSHRASGVS